MNSNTRQQRARKPIYDDPTKPIPSSLISTQSSHAGFNTLDDTKAAPSQEPTPTDRVTIQVRRARVGLYSLSTRAEASFNDFLTRAFNLEHNFTSTIRSLAPPPQANEPLLPGFIYILVGTLSGSILTRNRGIFLRFSVPLAFGIGAARATLPHTTRNVGDLIWRYEERFPEVAKAHLRVKERVETFWETGKSHAQMGAGRLEEKVVEAREGVEEWVKQGN